MGIRINTNVAAMSARRYLYNASQRVAKSMERLSSGLRINRAADDPAGLAISERLKSQIRALNQAGRNAADGISMISVGEGALDETSNMLIRMKELAQQAQTGTLSDEQRGHLNVEFQALIEEITRISDGTEFNGISLLDGSAGTVNIQAGIGAGGSSAIGVDLSGAFDGDGLGLTGLDISTVDPTVLGSLDAAMDSVNLGRAGFGAMQNRLESSIRVNANMAENLSAANSRIRDVDIASEMSELTSAQILQQMAAAMLVQAAQAPSLALRLLGIK